MKAHLTKDEEKSISTQKEMIENFNPIENLKPGDILRARSCSNYRYPEKGQLVVVYKVIPCTVIGIENLSAIRRQDFTILCKDPEDGEIMEFAVDSRFFEKVSVEK